MQLAEKLDLLTRAKKRTEIIISLQNDFKGNSVVLHLSDDSVCYLTKLTPVSTARYWHTILMFKNSMFKNSFA